MLLYLARVKLEPLMAIYNFGKKIKQETCLSPQLPYIKVDLGDPYTLSQMELLNACRSLSRRCL